MKLSAVKGGPALFMDLAMDGYLYWIDRCQRTVLLTDVLRRRGDNYLAHLKAGQPPVLMFNYQVVCEGRNLPRPVNYQLVQIMDRRPGSPTAAPPRNNEKRDSHSGKAGQAPGIHPRKRPIVIMDPRAGHGPGIGGSKMDSQVGVAIDMGHPVYFVIFFTDPVQGQTLADVQQCQIHFLEQVARRHPQAPSPAVIGNCQGGWAAALVAADRPDVMGPLVLNGSPLSYWGGVRGEHPMRYRGGILGGSWLASLSSDLGNGVFDGADLVAGFEDLNPANTLWSKLYHVFANIDTEEQRFLEFERWWGGFFLLSREEIHFIVNRLFVDDELEQGRLRLSPDRTINLRNMTGPILIFASRGDNITPPQQALNWIPKVYSSVDEIRRSGQVIIYLIHENIGHLGIFVSGKINRREHTGIIGCVDAIDFLPPGLYEMVIREGPSQPWLDDHAIDFVERTIDDILAMGDGFDDDAAFKSVSAVSRITDKYYNDTVGPWVRMAANDLSAFWYRQCHPLRVKRAWFSSMNPLLLPVASAAEIVKKSRVQIPEPNLFSAMEEVMSGWIHGSLDFYRKTRDNFLETLFFNIYSNEWMQTLYHESDDSGSTSENQSSGKTRMLEELEHQLWCRAMTSGSFEDAVTRIILAVFTADHAIGMCEYNVAYDAMKSDPRLKQVQTDQLKIIIRDQAAILEKDRRMAIETLPQILQTPEDRRAALEIARDIASADGKQTREEIRLIKDLEEILLSDREVLNPCGKSHEQISTHLFSDGPLSECEGGE